MMSIFFGAYMSDYMQSSFYQQDIAVQQCLAGDMMTVHTQTDAVYAMKNNYRHHTKW